VAEDTAVLPRVPDGAVRGTTTIADKVLERLAARAALEVPGVIQHSEGPDVLSAVTSDLPRVSAETAGDRVSIELKVAVDWASSAHEVAAALRDHVRGQLERLTGKTVDRVNVTVSALVMPPTAGHGRRVQ
jgi:uncharacterized alkaline shock family protein YloU